MWHSRSLLVSVAVIGTIVKPVLQYQDVELIHHHTLHLGFLSLYRTLDLSRLHKTFVAALVCVALASSSDDITAFITGFQM